jgi:hypothetical protein
MNPTESFMRLVRRREDTIPLAEAALLVAAHDHPVDVGAQLAVVDDLARDAPADVAALAEFLFVEQGFAGNEVDYGDPRNSYLDVVLEQAGVVHRIVTNDEFARFELAEDLVGHHHHLICSSCGTVEDVPPNAKLEQSLRHAVDQIAAATGFRTETHRVDLVGRCRRCA